MTYSGKSCCTVMMHVRFIYDFFYLQGGAGLGGEGGGGGCVFFGKIQIRISESKNGFCVFGGQIQKRLMNPLNPDSGRILRIKSKSGFSRFTIWASFWDRIWKKYFWQAVLRKKKWYATEAVHVWHCNWTYVGGALFLNPLVIFFVRM